MGKYFDHGTVFPIIGRLIREVAREKGGMATHEEVVKSLLKDPQGSRWIRLAIERDPEKKSQWWWASNMVQWFSPWGAGGDGRIDFAAPQSS